MIYNTIYSSRCDLHIYVAIPNRIPNGIPNHIPSAIPNAIPSTIPNAIPHSILNRPAAIPNDPEPSHSHPERSWMILYDPTAILSCPERSYGYPTLSWTILWLSRTLSQTFELGNLSNLNIQVILSMRVHHSACARAHQSATHDDMDEMTTNMN